jgi:hypothetical protein
VVVRFFFQLCAATWLGSSTASATDVTLVHQGRILDSLGEPVHGSNDLTIRLWNHPTNTAPSALLFEQPFPAVAFVDGAYSVTLGGSPALSADVFAGDAWVGVTLGSGAEMLPRPIVATVPRAATLSGGRAFPPGMVAFFPGACPAGFSEYTPARGRVVVGAAPTGTVAGTVGTALTNLGTRTLADVPAHTHSVDPPSTATSGDAHTHTYNDYYWEDSGNTDLYGTPSGDGVGDRVQVTRTTSSAPHSHTVDIAAFNLTSTGPTTVDVTMPYLQLVACRAD